MRLCAVSRALKLDKTFATFLPWWGVTPCTHQDLRDVATARACRSTFLHMPRFSEWAAEQRSASSVVAHPQKVASG